MEKNNVKDLQKLVDEVERRFIDCLLDDISWGYDLELIKKQLKMKMKEKLYDSVETYKAFKKLNK